MDIERIAALPLEERAAALTALIEELEEKLESTVTPHENPSPTKD